jgi:uncharacterized phage-associated protein
MTTADRLCENGPWTDKAIANTVLSWLRSDGVFVTPLKLQKIIYFAHVDHLKETKTGLVNQPFEAWRHGPVLPGLYEEFKEFSKKPIVRYALSFDPVEAKMYRCFASFDCSTEIIVRRSYEVYSRLSASALSHISHEADGPWDRAQYAFAQGRNINRTITDAAIADWLFADRIESLS